MQNKNILVVFTVLLALATLYTLSFNWVASGYEATADEYGAYVADSLEAADALGGQTFDEAASQAAREFLRDSATAEIYPVFGHTYRHVKEQELNLGLDLKGGMSVTLEVSLPDLIVALSDYSDNADFRGALADAKQLRKENSDDFVTNFESAWTARAPEVELWRIFHNMENKDLFPAKSTDAEIFEILRAEAQTAIDNTESIIRKRIDQLGVAQPNVAEAAERPHPRGIARHRRPGARTQAVEEHGQPRVLGNVLQRRSDWPSRSRQHGPRRVHEP